MIVPPQVLDQAGAGAPTADPLAAAGVTPAHALMAAAEMGRSGKLQSILSDPGSAGTPGSFKNKIEMQRTLDQLNGPRQAPAVKPGTKTPRGTIASKGYKRHG